MANTRKVLERLTDATATWKPHPKSFSAGDLGLHVASLIGWTSSTLSMTELDMNPPGGPAWKPPVYESAKRTLEVFEAEVVKARAALAAASDADFAVNWTLKNGGNAIFAMSRVAVIRIFVMNHIIHHRAQLTVSLRMKDIPVPSIYGPSDDEGNM
ncbi:MAG: damage-inducible protein DinB [Gemmatimonadetes bacterium]|nr:damage-inducible protein DinB [Gemmatimonadota bacterium]